MSPPTHPPSRSCQDRLVALRRRRTKPNPDNSMDALFHNAAQIDAKSQRTFGKLGPAWEQTCPANILPSTTLLRYQRSTLTVGVRDSTTLFLLQRALTPQFRDTLASLANVSLRRIDLRIHEPSNNAQ